MHTIVHYMYRDASNYKANGYVLLSGELTDSQCIKFVSKLDCEGCFVAEQIGLPALYEELFQYSNGRTIDDHSYHTFLGFEVSVDEPAAVECVWGTAEQFWAAVSKVEFWDISLSPNGNWF